MINCIFIIQRKLVHCEDLPLSEQAISTHVATRSPSSASTQVFLQPIAMPRWSISAKDVKDNALLAELFADFVGELAKKERAEAEARARANYKRRHSGDETRLKALAS